MSLSQLRLYIQKYPDIKKPEWKLRQEHITTKVNDYAPL